MPNTSSVPSVTGRGALGVIPAAWENFLACVLLHMLLPLLPIFLELFERGSLSQDSVTIAAAMYAIAIGLSSNSSLLFGISIVMSILFSVAHGDSVSATVKTGTSPAHNATMVGALAGIGMIFVLHAAERFRRHVQQAAPFFEFS